MKKAFRLFAAFAICAIMFASCKPEPVPDPEPETGLEGQYMPGKRISNIETFEKVGEDSLAPYMTKTFEWNGKLLHKYSENMRGEATCILTFEYDSLNRFLKIAEETPDSHGTYDFVYEEKQLVKLNQYENEELTDVYEFSRTDGKVTEVIHTSYNEETPSVTKRILTWDGDNIIQDVLQNPNESTVPTTYTFDDKVNPLQGLFTTALFYNLSTAFCPHNTLVTSFETSAAGMTLTTTSSNEYEYDADGYPTKSTNNITTTTGVYNLNITRESVYTYLP